MMESNSDEDGLQNPADFEYEAQHFGFTPIFFVNGLYNSVCDLYREALEAFCRSCAEEYPGVMTEEELKMAKITVGKKIDSDIDLVFDKLELSLVSDVFTIPENIVLPEDSCQLEVPSTQIDEELQKCKDKILAVKYANLKLQESIKEKKKLHESLQDILNGMKELKVNGKTATEAKDYISYCSDILSRAVEDPS